MVSITLVSTRSGSPTKPRSITCSIWLSGSRAVRVTLIAVTRPAVLARNADRLAAGPGDPADDLLVDLAREHHFGDLGGRPVGHPQAIDEPRFDPELLEHGADLRPAAMHHHRVDADRLEQHHVLGEIVGEILVAHRVAAVFDHESAAGIALQIGQRLGQGFGLGEQEGIGSLGHRPRL